MVKQNIQLMQSLKLTSLNVAGRDGISPAAIGANLPLRPRSPVITAPTSTGGAVSAEASKGTIAIGSDADLVIWDECEFVLRNEALHHAVDYTPYEGTTLRAWLALTLIGGEVVWDGKDFHPRAGRGRFLACGAPSLMPRRAD